MLPSTREVGQLMADQGFEQILAIPAMPSHAFGDSENEFGVNDDTGQSWYLRASSTKFDLIGKACLRMGMARCYSLGWGLTSGGQIPQLLLAQAFFNGRNDCDAVLSDLTAGLQLHGSILLTNLNVQWGLRCLRLAAALGDPDGP